MSFWSGSHTAADHCNTSMDTYNLPQAHGIDKHRIAEPGNMANFLSEELQALNAHRSQGKGMEGKVGDPDYALQLYRWELEEGIQILRDGIMGRSNADAVQTDRHILAEGSQAEDVAIRDRSLAQKLSGQEQCTAGLADGGDVEEPAKLAASNNSKEESSAVLVKKLNVGTAQSSAHRGVRRRTEGTVDQVCEICGEEQKSFDVARL
ncbi:uncharacterized protein K452DRAFT_301761 [Aplosporella prunicola CBS 121167]|uniref:Uncharacterized protein n=1 Tax=Aplosporella prunicola CBS 121167 TaxID=1176127 RepID=A0A6A6B1W5_9PEZI|nr:uncharacterized protein K452DRAFT_301761 [Aplosporella prunicola CBS 121167]KAF2137806.1 hypothetical protein K452DRAFT_301761 [Aplosporella prunicola CBS 121167]